MGVTLELGEGAGACPVKAPAPPFALPAQYVCKTTFAAQRGTLDVAGGVASRARHLIICKVPLDGRLPCFVRTAVCNGVLGR